MSPIPSFQQVVSWLNEITNAAQAMQIREFIDSLQAQNHELRKENLDLREKYLKEIETLKSEIGNLKQQLNESNDSKKIRDMYEFDKRLGIYRNKESGNFVCTSCLHKNPPMESPLQTETGGWRCNIKDCASYYGDPSYSPPKRANTDYY